MVAWVEQQDDPLSPAHGCYPFTPPEAGKRTKRRLGTEA